MGSDELLALVAAAEVASEHVIADLENADGGSMFALPGQTFGPELGFHARFETAGTYLWAQFPLADGSVITAPFTVTAG